MNSKLLTQAQASTVIRQVQPLLRANGSNSNLRLGQAIMFILSSYDDSMYHKIVDEDDFFYEEDNGVALEKFYKICVEDN